MAGSKVLGAGPKVLGAGSKAIAADHRNETLLVTGFVLLMVLLAAGLTGYAHASSATYGRAPLTVSAPADGAVSISGLEQQQAKKPSSANSTMQLAQNRLLPVQPAQNPQLIVDNLTGYPVDLLYIDQNRQYVRYKTIPNGRRLVEPSRLNFTWHFGVGGQSIIGTYTMSNLPQQIIRLDTNMLLRAGIQPPQQQRQQAQGQLLPPPRQQAGGQQGLLPPPGQQAGGQQGLLPPPVRQGGGQQAGALPPPGNQLPTDAELLARASQQQIPVPVLPPEAMVAPPLPPAVVVTPKRRSFSNQPWQESPSDSMLMFAGADRALSTNQHNELILVKTSDARSRATWFFEPVEGTDTFYMRNVQDVDGYIFIEPDAVSGTRVSFGPRGKQLETGKWRYDQKQQSIFHNVGRPDLKLFFSGGSITVTSDTKPRVGLGWVFASVGDFRGLMGFLSDNADSFVQMEKNVRENEQRIVQEAADKRAAEEKKHLDLQARPWVAAGGNGEDYLTVRLGFREIEEPAPGVKGLRYNYDPAKQPRISFGPIPSINTRVQTAQLILRPKVYAFTENNKLYIRVKTENGTQINMLTGGQAPTQGVTKNQFYIGSVRANISVLAGSPILISPVNQNTVTDAGFSKDQTFGVDLSLESFGGNFSQSQGSSINFSSNDFRVSGRNSQTFAQYGWEGCGLAVTVKTNDNCTYSGPEDMYDSDSASLRRIKDVALSMPLMITDTLFVIDLPAYRIPDVLFANISITVVFHSARRVRNKDKQFGKDFLSGMELVLRPDRWDIDKSLGGQEVIQNRKYITKGDKQIGKFKIDLAVDISQLKPFFK